MSSLLDHLDSNQSENDDIQLLFPKCKPRASSVGTESQSSESQSNSQQYLADNLRDQNLNHHPSSTSVALGGSGGGITSQSSRQSSRRHSSSGFTHHPSQQQQNLSQPLPDNLLKHSKHSSYPPLINTQNSPSATTGNASFIGHAPLSPYDNNNVTHDIVGSGNSKGDSSHRSSQSNHHHHHHQHHHSSSSRHHHHHHQQQQQQPQSDSSDNFPITSFGGTSGATNNNKSGEGHHHHHHSHHSGSVKSHHHSRSKNSLSSRNSRHEALASTGSGQSQSSRHHSRSSHHHHHHSSHHHSNSERPHHHHRSKKLTHMTESSSCEPLSPQQVNKSSLSNSRYNKSHKSLEGGVPTKSYSTLSLGSGMECETLDDHHLHRHEQLYDDGFCTTRSQRNLTTSNGASVEHTSSISSRNSSNNLPGNGGCLRDSRIEIAGGREIYSQNRIRAGRRLRGSSSTSSSTEMMADSSISMTATSSSSSAPVPNKARKKSPNVQQHQHPQQQQQLVCTNGDVVGSEASELSIWEPKHSSKQYQENMGAPSRSHHEASHRHHGSQHHHPHNHHHHHHQQHHHSHARNRHCCGYPHCDHSKLLSPTELSPACGGGSSSYNKSPCGEHNNASGMASAMTVKETVFSTEITSIEKPIETEIPGKNLRSSTSNNAPTGQNLEAPYVYEQNVNVGDGEIIFDDIGGTWNRAGEDGGRHNAPESGGGGLRAQRKDSIKRSPSGGGRQNSQHGGGGHHPNFFHPQMVRGSNEGSGGGSGMHCCSSLEQINHSGSGVNTNHPPTVLMQGSPSPSTRGGNTTPSGYESDEYSGVTPVSLNMMGCGSNKGCLPNNRLIGAVELAEYEGSPKRYGLRQPTHPMPTHLDLVDVDMQMNSSMGNDHDTRSPSEINSSGGSIGSNHVVSLMSPTQPSKSTGNVPTTTSSSSSSLDNTSSNVSSSSVSSSNNNSRNFYSSKISPRVLSPSQSISSFPSRVPGFPQRITPVTSSLDSSSLVDSGLEKSEATDTKSDSILETEGGMGDEILVDTCHRNDESSAQQDQMNKHPYPHHHQQQPKTGDSSSAKSNEVDEGTTSQAQLVNSGGDHHHQSSSDLLLTDQLNNVKGEKCIPSSNSNTTNLCGNPLDESQHVQAHHHHHLQQQQQQQQQQHQQQQQMQQYQMVLELVDSAMSAEDHHQSLQHNQTHQQHNMIHSLSETGEDGTNKMGNGATGNSTNTANVNEQCLISVPSSTSTNIVNSQQHTESLDGHNASLIGIGATCSSSDYLYEFSETRKVLEEFFGSTSGSGGGGGEPLGGVGVGGGSGGGGCVGGIMGLDGNSMNSQGPLFDDLDYTLKRQAGNSYVGQRLAGERCSTVEESPKKPARRGVLLLGSSDGDGGEGGEAASPRLISFQEITLPQLQQQQLHHHQQKTLQNPPRDLNDNDIDGDTSSTNTETDNLGDTEVGLQVGLSRNFTLSPETTDCDSNELESEISLDYEASLHSSSRVGASMPAVEDGLSSGNVSDTEELVPSSDQLNNDLKRVSHHHQQGLLCSNAPITGNTICSSNNATNNPNNRQQPPSSLGGQRRGDHPQNSSAVHSHHHLNHHQHLIEDGLECNGSPPQGAPSVSASNLQSLQQQSSSTSSSLSQQQSQQLQQQQHPVSPSSSASISNSKIPSDPNPTLLLMKKQISEIEKEIKMRASQQTQKMQLQNSSVDNSSLNSTNSMMPLVTDEPNNGSNSCSTTNIASSMNNGNSCGITTNGNGLNITSSCPDVSTLSSSTNNATTQSGQGARYPQQQAPTGTSNNNGPGSHHRDSSLPLVSNNTSIDGKGQETTNFDSIDIELEALDPMRPTPPPSPAPSSLCQPQSGPASGCASNNNNRSSSSITGGANVGNSKVSSSSSSGSASATAAPINIPSVSGGPPGSSSCNISNTNSRILTSGGDSNPSVISPDSSSSSSSSVAAAIQDIKEAIQRTKTLPRQPPSSSHVETSRPSPLTSSQSHADAHNSDTSPVWVPRQGASSYHHHRSGERGVKDPLLRKQRYDETPDDDADTDQETDRLLGQTRTEDDYGFYDEKEWKKVKNCRSLLPALNKGVSFVKSAASGSVQPLGLSSSASSLNTGSGGGGGGGAGSNTNSNHGVPSYSSTSNTIAPSSARISPAPFKQQQEPLPSSQLNSSSSNNANSISSKPKKEKDGIKKKRSKEDLKNPSVLIEGVLFRARYLGSTQLVCEGQPTKATRMMQAEEAVSRIKTQVDQSDLSSETEPLGTHNVSDSAEPGIMMHTNSSSSTTTTASSSSNNSNNDKREQVVVQPQFEDYLYAEDDDSGDESCAESEFFHKGHHSIQSPTSSARSFQAPCFGGTSPGDPGTLSSSVHFGPACGSALPGTMFRLKFIGSLEVDEEVGSGKRRRKRPKKTMVEEAVMKMKAPEGETQPSTEVDLFISTEKIMVLNTDLKEIMMDHALRTISYIADIGDLVVLMARRRPVPSDTPEDSKIARPPKMICHVFESDEAQYIAQSIGQAFQVAYMEFLKANGIEDQSFVREMDYQEVLNSQEIFGDELQMFAKKELQKEVVVPKSKGEILGVVIVESGWGSMLPTVVIANLAPAGAAARCGQLNIGDQIIAINGVSLVGLPLSTCQNYIKNTKSQTVVKLTVVPCPPVVEVKIKRPDTKYQLGFSVQNGVICSLLRGGIAERGGVRVGHRIIEINGQSVVAVPHEKIVNLLATSVGEINMKTMPTSMFRLLTGQETPLYI